MPESLVRLLTRPVPVSTWLPSVHSLALTMVFRDLVGGGDGGFMTFVRASTRAMYQTPMYRILMVVVDSLRLLEAAGVRWSKFNRGSTMAVIDATPGSAVIRFEYPPNLYSPAHYAGLEGAYSAALEVAGARLLRCERRPHGDSRVDFQFTWT